MGEVHARKAQLSTANKTLERVENEGRDLNMMQEREMNTLKQVSVRVCICVCACVSV